uniref:C2H2-type domain-containing protein n=1 Tax=Anopheles christyi TaxID=43041 RepID=A0A182K331_9DIPT
MAVFCDINSTPLSPHFQSHTEHMPFKCEYCARLFKHKRSRDRHTKLHTGDRRYRCLHCEAAFSRSDHLKIHMKTHDNQKPFQCTICNRGYNTAAALTSHMQNHKKQLALTGSPNLTYSPRSTTSSLSSGGGGGGGSGGSGKRGAKFSPYSTDPLLLMSRGNSKLSSSLAKASSGNAANSNRTPTPGSTGTAAAGGPHQDLLSCPYCTRTDFGTLEQLGLHVQSMHGHGGGGAGGALGLLGADTSLPYFTPGGRRAVTPDGNALSLGGLSPYPPITCEFCTMKFPTVPLMFAHLKTAHLDRLAGGSHQRSSPSNGSPLGSRPPSSGFHPLDQLHFNKSLLGNAFPSFYGGMGGNSNSAAAGMSGGSMKASEHRTCGDENGKNDVGRKRKRREDEHAKERDRESVTKRDKQEEPSRPPIQGEEEQDNEGEDSEPRGTINRSESVDDTKCTPPIKQERKEELEHPATSPATSARSSPCCDSSLESGSVRPNSHSPAEQLTPTDLSQPKMKRLKLEMPEDDELHDGDNKASLIQPCGRSHVGSREQQKQRSSGPVASRRDSDSKESHLSTLQHASLVHSVQHTQPMGASTSSNTGSSSAQHAQPPPGAYLCNQCNAALPDFESFRTHLKAHLEQSAASAAAAAAMRLSGEHGIGSSSGNGATTVAQGSSLSLTTFHCQQCGATLSCQAEYEQHTIGHFLVMAVEYRCQAAGGTGGTSCSGKGTFGKVEDLHKHLYEGHMQLLYKCTVCGETFESKVQVQVHFAVSHSVEVKLYRCSACAEVFRSERDFRQHIRNRHLTAGAVQCMFCRMVCSSELEMHFHLASHARKYKCPACPESFHVEFLLDRHIQTHHSQKETNSPNRRESTVNHNLSLVGQSTSSSSTTTNNTTTSINPPPTPSSTTTTAVSTVPTSTVTGLDYLHLHGQMAAMAAAAAWPSLYQTANKFYGNPLQVDTLNQLKHPQHLLHGFYDTMLGKAQQQQRVGAFLSDPPSSTGGKKHPFAGHSPNTTTTTTNALLGLGYGATANSQQQRTAGSHTLNGTPSSGLYSPEEPSGGTGSNVPTNNSSKLYSPIAMIQRYGDSGLLHTTASTTLGTAASSGGPSRAESPTPPGGQLLALPEHHPEQTGNRKAMQQSGTKQSGPVTPQQIVASSSSSCYSCGICERSDFSTESEVQTHRKIVHNLKTGVSLRCAYCNGDFRSRNELENHMKVAHNTGGGKHKCLICDEIFPSPAVLAEHKLTHCKVGASGRCSHCSLPLPDAHTFKQHLPAHQQSATGGSSGTTGGAATNATNGGGTSGSVISSAGQNASSSAGSNTTTTSSATDQERFPQQCICCRQTLNSEFEISLHAKFHTKSPDTNERTCALCLEPLPSQPESNTKICDPCLKRHNFPSKLLSMNFLKPPAASSLVPAPNLGGPSAAVGSQTHGTMGNSGPLEGGRPPTSTTIHQHQDGPTPAGLYQCNLCKKPLPSSQKLQEHLIEHTFAGCEERGYVCYLCSAVFTSSAGLQTHLPLAHSNAAAKPYDCERCGVAYFFRAELEHHLIDHELGTTVRPTFEHSDVRGAGGAGDEWHTAQGSPLSEDDDDDGKGHIKQEQCEPEQEHDGSSPYPQKGEDSEEENEYQASRNEEDEEEADMEEQEEDREQPHTEGDDNGQAEKDENDCDEDDDEDDDVAVGVDERNEAAEVEGDDEEQHREQQEQDEDEDEEYIEVEHTTMEDGGRGKPSDERLRRASNNMLINGGKDCSVLTATTAATTLPVVTAAE